LLFNSKIQILLFILETGSNATAKSRDLPKLPVAGSASLEDSGYEQIEIANTGLNVGDLLVGCIPTETPTTYVPSRSILFSVPVKVNNIPSVAQPGSADRKSSRFSRALNYVFNSPDPTLSAVSSIDVTPASQFKILKAGGPQHLAIKPEITIEDELATPVLQEVLIKQEKDDRISEEGENTVAEEVADTTTTNTSAGEDADTSDEEFFPCDDDRAIAGVENSAEKSWNDSNQVTPPRKSNVRCTSPGCSLCKARGPRCHVYHQYENSSYGDFTVFGNSSSPDCQLNSTELVSESDESAYGEQTFESRDLSKRIDAEIDWRLYLQFANNALLNIDDNTLSSMDITLEPTYSQNKLNEDKDRCLSAARLVNNMFAGDLDSPGCKKSSSVGDIPRIVLKSPK
jgi:hypothetical protein